MGLTVYDFMCYCLEEEMQEVEIWDCDEEEVVWSGLFGDIPNKYGASEVQSWNLMADFKICFNI